MSTLRDPLVDRLREIYSRIDEYLSDKARFDEHPLTDLYLRASKVYQLASSGLEMVERELKRVKIELEAQKQQLSRRYGSGYITTKKVKKYIYIVYRVRKTKRDIYLKEGGQQLIQLRKRLRFLKTERERLRKIRHYARILMLSTEEYSPLYEEQVF